jgi:pyrroloquinoline quinone biosynthesis protein A
VKSQPEDAGMKWETPSFNDIRFGFEVTMYVYNR